MEVVCTCFVFIYLIPVMPLNFLDSPAGDTLSVAHLASRPVSASGTPDLLINSLELKRTFRKWSHDKEKVRQPRIVAKESKLTKRRNCFRICNAVVS